MFPDDYFYINEPTEENLNNPLDAKYFLGEGEEIDKKIDEVGDDLIASPFKGSFLSDSIATIYKYYKVQRTSEYLDDLKKLGYTSSTTSGITTVSYTHLTLPTTLHECRSRWSPYH